MLLGCLDIEKLRKKCLTRDFFPFFECVSPLTKVLTGLEI